MVLPLEEAWWVTTSKLQICLEQTHARIVSCQTSEDAFQRQATTEATTLEKEVEFYREFSCALAEEAR